MLISLYWWCPYLFLRNNLLPHNCGGKYWEVLGVKSWNIYQNNSNYLTRRFLREKKINSPSTKIGAENKEQYIVLREKKTDFLWKKKNLVPGNVWFFPRAFSSQFSLMKARKGQKYCWIFLPHTPRFYQILFIFVFELFNCDCR